MLVSECSLGGRGVGGNVVVTVASKAHKKVKLESKKVRKVD